VAKPAAYTRWQPADRKDALLTFSGGSLAWFPQSGAPVFPVLVQPGIF
jgi:hypothetical protein